MLKIENLCFGFENTLLDHLNLELNPGDRVVITGPSGSGKSTLVQLISGLFRPKKGCINLTCEASYMGQQDALLPWKTLEDNLSFAKSLQSPCSSQSFKKEISSLLEGFDLAGCGHLYPRLLSGGMRQRAALAQAFLFDKPLMILDEPFSSLDPALKRKVIQKLIAFLNAKNKSLLMITHHYKEIEMLNAAHYALISGKLIQQKR